MQPIELAFRPIWMQQPGESEHMYKAFLAFVECGQVSGNMVVTARGYGFDAWICQRNHWVKRKNAYWFEAIDMLKGQAVKAAHLLMEERVYEESEHSERVGGKDGDTVTTTRRTKKHQPDARVVIRVLDEITKPANDSTDGSEISTLLQAMVSSTIPGNVPPAENGVVE